MRKLILGIDFDGTIHSYSSGWKGKAVIPDPPTKGAIDFIRTAMAHYTVAIVSSRFSDACRTGMTFEAVRIWLTEHGLDVPIAVRNSWPEEPDWADGTLILSSVRPPAFLTIDDRGWTFDGTWPDMDTLRNFRPWNKR